MNSLERAAAAALADCVLDDGIESRPQSPSAATSGIDTGAGIANRSAAAPLPPSLAALHSKRFGKGARVADLLLEASGAAGARNGSSSGRAWEPPESANPSSNGTISVGTNGGHASFKPPPLKLDSDVMDVSVAGGTAYLSANTSSRSIFGGGQNRSDAGSEAGGDGGKDRSVRGGNGGGATPGSAFGSMHGGTSFFANGGGSVHGGMRSPWKRAGNAAVASRSLAARSRKMSSIGMPHHGGGVTIGAIIQFEQEAAAEAEAEAAKVASPLCRALTAFNAVLSRFAIDPDARWYALYWFLWAVAITILSCWIEPFYLAFRDSDYVTGLSVWLDPIEYIILATFLLDFAMKFFVGFDDPVTGVPVCTQPAMAVNYMRSWKFFLDLLGCLPYDTITYAIVSAANGGQVSDTAQLWIDWLKLLTLTRVYRVFELFTLLDYRMVLSQGALMILRNYTYVFFTIHWAACIFYHIAHQQGNFGSQTWIGRNSQLFRGQPVWAQYLLALYFSTTVFTAMGDAALYPYTVTEMAVMIVYLMFNLFLAAYIIGTVTIMMVKADEHSKAFRESMENLNEYGQDNELPQKLQSAMKEHLEVNFDSAHAGDDKVLSIYPTTIRRRALRHLYMEPMKGCYLFRKCTRRFLDALITAARVELFLPGVEILTEGDNVVDLLIIVAGEVLVSQGGARAPGSSMSGVSASFGGAQSAVGMSFTGGVHGGGVGVSFSAGQNSVKLFDDASTPGGGGPDMSSTPGGGTTPSGGPKMKFGKFVSAKKGTGDALAEIAFFTEGACHEAVVGTTPVRVLSLPRAAWELLMTQFPQQARLVLENLQRATEDAVDENLRKAASKNQLTSEQLQVALALVKGDSAAIAELDPLELADTRDALTQPQIEMLARLDDVRSTTSAHVRKVDEKRTFELLNTAAQGDLESLRTMLGQGINANTADYDGRTALMLAAAKGHLECVRLLLQAGADKNKIDAFGNSAMAEAAKGAHDKIVDLMLAFDAELGAEGLAVAADLCTAVYRKDLVKLKRLLRAGAPPDSCDYDKRSALHIAGAEGNLAAVKILIEDGGADPLFQDRWGNTALDEARRVGAAPVVAYLEGISKRKRRNRRSSTGEEELRQRQQAAKDYMGWCGLGDAAKLREAGGYRAGEAAGCAFAGLMLAASKGHSAVVEALLPDMPTDALHRTAPTAMLEAARVGHDAAVAAFRAAGVTLRDPHARHLRVRLLVEQGGAVGDLAAVDGAGRTPLKVAEAALAAQPSEPRVRAVHEYLSWAVTATGTQLSSVAALAVLRWGPINAPPPPAPAADSAAGVLALADDPIAAETTAGTPPLSRSGASGERLLGQASSNGMPQSAAAAHRAAGSLLGRQGSGAGGGGGMSPEPLLTSPLLSRGQSRLGSPSLAKRASLEGPVSAMAAAAAAATAAAAAPAGGGARMPSSPFASVTTVDALGAARALPKSASAANLMRMGTDSGNSVPSRPAAALSTLGPCSATPGADDLAAGLPPAVGAGDMLPAGGDYQEDSPLPGTPGSTNRLSSLAASMARHQQQQLGADGGARASEPGGGLGLASQYSAALPSVGSLGSPLLPVMPPGQPGAPAAVTTGGGMFVGSGSRRNSFRVGGSTVTGLEGTPGDGMAAAGADHNARPASGHGGLAAAQSARLLHSATRRQQQLLSQAGLVAPSPVASLSNVLLVPRSPRRSSTLVGETDEIETYLYQSSAGGGATSVGGSFARRSETSVPMTGAAAGSMSPVSEAGRGAGSASGHGFVSGAGGRTLSRMRRDSAHLSSAASNGAAAAATAGSSAAVPPVGVSMGGGTTAASGSFRRTSNSTHSTGLMSPASGSNVGLRAVAAAGAAAAAAGPLSPVTLNGSSRRTESST
ncbi:hypothetical protein HXX76_001103 [Chlamydomonas incerta]|uniref:Cyclic nucleotide-binding domain-containing protein n=1 Tax=Chlamydomonas incerta TaxID=51695 RepID=A0A835WBI3_CHLIN|nr:hypothetical protein HXX76_001103 [Chlamydomonas incerta]|eukprot:KAG2444347.1 hypothetical protein HXX76_001103 [Chlamydomonas incerta]